MCVCVVCILKKQIITYSIKIIQYKIKIMFIH